MAATSLQYEFMAITADNIIWDAFERCGVPHPSINKDKLTAAKRSLNFIFAHLPNKGLNLFTVNQELIEIIPGVTQYELPDTTSKVLEAKQTNTLRQLGGTPSASEGEAGGVFSGVLTNPCVQTDIGGNISYLFPQGTPILYVGIMSAITSTYSFSIECSYLNNPSDEDWIVLLETSEDPYYFMQTNWFVLPYTKNAVNWRIRDTSLNPLNIAQVYFNTQTSSIPMQSRGRDMYFWSNTNQTEGSATTFWMDRINTPTFNVYPYPGTQYQFFVYNCVRYIQDVDQLFQSIAINSRFLEAVTASLALYLAEKLEGFDLNKYDRLAARAEQLYIEAGKEDYENVNTIVSYSDDQSGY